MDLNLSNLFDQFIFLVTSTCHKSHSYMLGLVGCLDRHLLFKPKHVIVVVRQEPWGDLEMAAKSPGGFWLSPTIVRSFLFVGFLKRKGIKLHLLDLWTLHRRLVGRTWSENLRSPFIVGPLLCSKNLYIRYFIWVFSSTIPFQ